MSNRARRRIKRLFGLSLIVVDYIQLMKTNAKKYEGRVQELSEITQGLKALAKELSVPVLALYNYQGSWSKETIKSHSFLT